MSVVVALRQVLDFGADHRFALQPRNLGSWVPIEEFVAVARCEGIAHFSPCNVLIETNAEVWLLARGVIFDGDPPPEAMEGAAVFGQSVVEASRRLPRALQVVATRPSLIVR